MPTPATLSKTGVTENPFSSHRVEPRCGGYIFTGNGSLEDVLDNLRAHGWRGELNGPCGAGKSTLLQDICDRLNAEGLQLVRWRCYNRQRFLPAGWTTQLRNADIAILDGGEQLMPGFMPLLRVLTRLRGKGLIITSHRRQRIGAFIPIKPNAAALAQKVEHLRMTEAHAEGLSPAAVSNIEARLLNHNGNAREVLFDLYMEHESGGFGAAT